MTPLPGIQAACRLSVLALLAASLGACAPKQEAGARDSGTTPPAAQQPPAAKSTTPEKVHGPHQEQTFNRAREKELMRLIFPGEREQENEVSFHILHASGEEHYLMLFASAREYPDGRLVVVVNGSPADDEGEGTSEHGAGSASVYVLRRQAGKWAVAKRHEHAADVGSFGDPGNVKWISVGPGKEGFVVHTEYADIERNHVQGDAHVFALEGEELRYLGGIAAFGDQSHGCKPDWGVCTDAQGVVRFADAGAPYHDLLLDFTGRRYSGDNGYGDEKVIKVQSAIRQTARYRFNGKAYVLVSGTNPLERG